MRRTAVFLATVVAFLAVSVGPNASTASADPILDLRCELSGTLHLTPGVNLVARDFSLTLSGVLTTCVELTATSPRVISGTITASGTGFGSCTGVSADATQTVTWLLSDGSTDTSTLAVHVQATAIPPTIVASGVVTSGRFTGDTAQIVLLTGQVNPLDCLTDDGVTQASGTATELLYSIP